MAKKPEFSDRLKSLRESAGLTQAELAERTGMAQANVSLLESGKRQPMWATVCSIADALKVSTEFFRVA